MALFPVFLNIKDKLCLVIGGGPVAERKVRNLLECQARIKVTSPEATKALQEMAEQGKVEWRKREYLQEDLNGVFMVFIATDRQDINRQVIAYCREKGIMLNAADDPDNCDFFVPSLLRRRSLSIAVSTEGKSPLLARKLREELEELVPDEYGLWIDIVGQVREYIKTRVDDTRLRQKLYKYLLEPDIWEEIKQGREDIIRERIDKCISSWRA